MIHEARNAVRGGAAVRGGRGETSGGTSIFRLARGWPSRDSPPTGARRDGATCPACLENEAGGPSLPSLGPAVFIGHDEFRLCPGTTQTPKTAQCRCTNIVTTTKEISTPIWSLSV